jgi:hypothetical protein
MKFNVAFNDDDAEANVDLSALLNLAFPPGLFPQSLKDRLDGVLSLSWLGKLQGTDGVGMFGDIGLAHQELDYDSDVRLGSGRVPFTKATRLISYRAKPDKSDNGGGLATLAIQINRLPPFMMVTDPDVEAYPAILARIEEACTQTRKLSMIQFKHWLDTLAIYKHATEPITLSACEMKQDGQPGELWTWTTISMLYQLNANYVLSLDLRLYP